MSHNYFEDICSIDGFSASSFIFYLTASYQVGVVRVGRKGSVLGVRWTYKQLESVGIDFLRLGWFGVTAARDLSSKTLRYLNLLFPRMQGLGDGTKLLWCNYLGRDIALEDVCLVS